MAAVTTAASTSFTGAFPGAAMMSALGLAIIHQKPNGGDLVRLIPPHGSAARVTVGRVFWKRSLARDFLMVSWRRGMDVCKVVLRDMLYRHAISVASGPVVHGAWRKSTGRGVAGNARRSRVGPWLGGIMAKKSVSASDLTWIVSQELRNSGLNQAGVGIAVVSDAKLGWRVVMAERIRSPVAPEQAEHVTAVEKKLRREYSLSKE